MSGWDLLGRSLLLFGGIMVLLGLVFLFAPRFPFLGKLPGDIFIQKGNFSFFFPLATCLLASLGLTLLVNLILFLLRR
ncbi:MAG: DUF2905 domain-containing protein [Chloroflexi bacterium]|nr:MAG: DUF2905 domain-containing protein [Chloroflexota bacterium]